MQGAKGGSGETRKKAIVENQAKEDTSWNRGGSSVMVHFGIPLSMGAMSVGTLSGVAGCRYPRSGQAGMQGL